MILSRELSGPLAAVLIWNPRVDARSSVRLVVCHGAEGHWTASVLNSKDFNAEASNNHVLLEAALGCRFSSGPAMKLQGLPLITPSRVTALFSARSLSCSACSRTLSFSFHGHRRYPRLRRPDSRNRPRFLIPMTLLSGTSRTRFRC